MRARARTLYLPSLILSGDTLFPTPISIYPAVISVVTKSIGNSLTVTRSTHSPGRCGTLLPDAELGQSGLEQCCATVRHEIAHLVAQRYLT